MRIRLYASWRHSQHGDRPNDYVHTVDRVEVGHKGSEVVVVVVAAAVVVAVVVVELTVATAAVASDDRSG